MNKASLKYVMVMIAMCGCVGGSVGVCMGTSGLFYASVCAELGISKSAISMSYTITAITAAFSGLLIPRILRNEKNLKALIIAGSLMAAGGTFLLSLSQNIWMYDLFCLIRGFGSGLLSFVLATTVINQWFLAKNGIMISVAMAFSGLPGVLLSNVFSAVIENSGWRFGYIVVTIVLLVFFLPAMVFPIRLRPDAFGLKPYGYEEFQKYKEAHPEKSVVEAGGSAEKDYLQEIVLLTVFTVIVYMIASMLQHMPGFALSLGFSAAVGALMTSFASASNIFSKIAYGVLCEKFGPFKSSILYALINCFAIVMMLTIRAPWAMIIGAFLFGFTFANSSSALSIITRDTFGFANYTKVYPRMSFAGAAANALGMTFLGMLYDMTGTYFLTFCVCLAGQIIVIMTLLFLSKLVHQRQ